jgi:uncharacterized protein
MLGPVGSWLWNAEERRPRALVRIGLHGLGLVLAGTSFWLMVATLSVAAGWPRVGLAFFGWWYPIQAIVVIGVTLAAVSALDRREPSMLGIGRRPGYLGDLAFGVGIGAACMASIAIVEDLAGWARYVPLEIDRERAWDVVVVIDVFVCVAIIEELVSRGYHLRNLEDGLSGARGTRWARGGALALSSVVFGVAHAGNPDASALAVLNIAIGGAFLGIGALLQGDLALPLGVHFGWNLAQCLFGMPVSGNRWPLEAALFERVELGPDAITGGAFGPEGGSSGLCAMAFGALLTIAWIRARARAGQSARRE